MPSPPELSPVKRAFWTLGAVANQLVWGMQPVATRWLQSRAHVSTMSLVFMACTTSFLANTISSTVNHLRGTKSSTASQQETTIPTSTTTPIFGHKNIGLLVAIVYACRSSTNFLSASLTQAYTIAMIQMLGVYVMAGGSWFVLGEEVPPAMWVALTVSLAGSLMVLFGQEQSSDDDSMDKDSGYSHWDIIGVATQCASLFFSTCARLQMRLSEDNLSPMQFMRFQVIGGAALALGWSMIMTGAVESIQPWLQLTSTDWAVFLGLGIMIHFVAATMQVYFNRKLGVATYACFQPMRLVGSVIGSSAALNEPVSGMLTWVGLGTVGLTVTAYALYKQRSKSKMPQPVETNNTSNKDTEGLIVERQSKPTSD